MKKVLNILSPFKVILLFPLMFFLALSQIYAVDNITLEWDPNTDPDLAGYYFYLDTNMGDPYYEFDFTGIEYSDDGGSSWFPIPDPPPIDVGTGVTQIALRNLDNNETYYFAVKAYDNQGRTSAYSNEVDTKAPQITSPPTITSMTDETVTIDWQTDESGNSEVQYQPNTGGITWGDYGNKVTDPSMITSHSVTLTGLSVETQYFFRVGSTDAGGAGPNISDTDNNPSEEFDFFMNQGPDTEPPVITSPPTVTSITDTSAMIVWETDEPSTSEVQYGTSSGTWGNYQWSKDNADMVTIHSVTLTGLSATTKYYFRVGSTDVAPSPGPYTTTSNEANFTTVSGDDTTPPQITSPPTVTGTTQTMAIIEWETDEPSTSEVRYDIGTHDWELYPQDTRVINTSMVTTHSVTLTGLSATTKYYFRVGSTDGAPPPGPYTTTSNEMSFTTETALDEPPRIISPPTVTNITNSTALIQWRTDEPSNSQVQHGTSSSDWGSYQWSKNRFWMVTNHRVTLTGLSAGTKYYFRVGSTDASGNGPDPTYPNAYENCSDELSLTTTAPDTAAPVISNVSDDVTIDIIKTDDTAIITWTTDEPSNSQVRYGTVSSDWGSYQWSKNGFWMVTNHRVTLTGLTPGTYYFRVGSTDASGNGPDLNSNSTNPSINEYSFDTGSEDDTDPPVISLPTVTAITDTTAIIEWQTDEPSNSQVQYSTSPGNSWGSYPSSENDAEMVTSHSVTLTGLAPSTPHYYRVGSTDAFGNAASLPSEETFTTKASGYNDTTPPQITLLKSVSITESTAVIEWETDELSNSMVQYQKGSGSTWGNYIHSKNDAEMVYSHSVTLAELEDNTRYYFRVGSTDAFGNSPDPTYPNAYENCSDELLFDTTERQDKTRPYITGYTVDYFNDTITITYSEKNIQNATIEANYSFSIILPFRTTGGSNDITYNISNDTYTLFLKDIPEDKSFTIQALSGITDEANNPVTDDKYTIDVTPDSDRIKVKEAIPHHNAGIEDNTRVSRDTSFAVLIEATDGINIDTHENITFKINDGVHIYEYNLGNTKKIRVVQLDPTELTDNVTKLWAVYDKSKDFTYPPNFYGFDETVEIYVNIKDTKNETLESGYSFKIETEQQQIDAEKNLPPTTTTQDPFSGLTTITVDSGDLAGAKIIFDSSETISPTFGPLAVLGSDEPPLLNISNVQAVGSSALNLQPPTVFDDPIDTPTNIPVTIFIPCPGHQYASALNVYRYKGASWVLACVGNNVATGGEGWIVPGSRKDHDNGSPSTIEIQVYHFAGVQAGFSSGSGGRSSDEVAGGGCFIATAAYGSNMDKHVKILTKFRDRRLVTNHIGRGIVDTYYKFSPSVASYLHKHPFARAVVRYALIPITGVAYVSLYIHPLALLFAFIFMLLTGVYCFEKLAIRSRRSAM